MDADAASSARPRPPIWGGRSAGATRAGTEPVLVLFVVVPEEILFRGGLAVLIDAVHPVAFVVASAVLFGLIHFPFGTRDVLVKMVNGAIFAVVFLVTGSLTASVLIHLGYNLASFHVYSDYTRDVVTLP